ncbi:MAG: hypothetical protein ACKOBV_04290, partial [Candidatus Kapaibacterium sp.]
NGSGSFLTFTNTNNFTQNIGTFQYISNGVNQGCTNDTIRNCTISTGSNVNTTFAVYLAGNFGSNTSLSTAPSGLSIGLDHRNLAFIDNTIQQAQYGIFGRSFNNLPASIFKGLLISGNRFGSSDNSATISLRPIDIQGADGMRITNNTITNVYTSLLGTAPIGIELGTWVINSSITRNVICGVTSAFQSPVGVYGIDFVSSVGVINDTVANNAVSGLTSVGFNDPVTSVVAGIRLNQSQNIRVYHNTVNLTGSFLSTNAANSVAFLATTSSISGMDIRNNIFINNMTGATGSKCYAMYLNQAQAFTLGQLNNNDLVANGSTNFVSYWNNTDFPSLSSWQNSGLNQDQGSVNIPVSFAGSGCSNFYLPTVNTSLIGTSALLSAVPSDVDALQRIRPYMGADEVTPIISISAQPQSQNLCSAQALNLAVTSTLTFNDNVSRPDAALTYQWQKNGSNISGATGSTYSIASASMSDAGSYRVIIRASSIDSSVSNVAVITVSDPITITQQPVAPAALCAGSGGFTLTTSATGTGVTYQWQQDRTRGGTFANISGATSATYTVASVAGADSGNYRCVITGAAACTPSTQFTNVVNVVVRIPVSILVQPVSPAATCQGQSISLSVSAQGTITSYQWQKDQFRTGTFTNVNGATGAAINFSPLNPSDSGNYRVVVTGPCNTVTSFIVNVNVLLNATITQQPVTPAPPCIGGSVSFSVTATGTVTSYQWQKSPAGAGTFTNVFGGNGALLQLLNVQLNDAGDYRVVVTGPCQAPINSNVVNLVVNSPITITSQPAFTRPNTCTGESTTLSMTASGTVASYQWQKFDGSAWQNIAGATTNSYTINNLTLTDAGAYRMQLSGPCSPTTVTNQAALAVQQNVLVSQQPQPQTVCVGGGITFTAATVGTVVSYQWQQDQFRNGTWVNIPGATSATYTKAVTVASDSGNYRLLVVGTCSATPVSSSSASATIQIPFVVVSQPSWPATAVTVGSTVTLNVGVTG